MISFYEWRADQWDSRQEGRTDVSPELKEGIKAYAVEQAALQRSLSSTCQDLWKTPLKGISRMLQEDDDDAALAETDDGALEDDDSEDEHFKGTESFE